MLPLTLTLTLTQITPVYGVQSPDRQLAAKIDLGQIGALNLTVTYRGKRLLAPSGLGLDLADGGPFQRGVHPVSTAYRKSNAAWRNAFGKSSLVRDRYNELTLAVRQGVHGRRVDLILRAYDEGIAFRYRVPKQNGLESYDVRSELTSFRPLPGFQATALVLPNERTPYEEPYQRGPLKDASLIGLPLTLTYPDGTAVAFTEADLDDFPGLYLKPNRGVLNGHLSPRLDDSGLAAKQPGPFQTPWRVVMIGDPKRLLESNMILNLNPPSVLKDVSWIKPGKTIFPWWNGYFTNDARLAAAQTTEYHKWCIDFAAKHKIPYHSIDGLDNLAWYGGRIVPYDGGPLTKGRPGLDLEEIVRYAKSKGVRIRLWMAAAAARAQMDVAYPYYEKLGIEGVMVDFFDRDDQDTVRFVRRVVAKAAKHHLTITLHNVYKPTGLRRTYPNLLTVEAARNLEFDKWDPKGITPEHEMDVAYVRGLAGPIDFHSGSFRNVAQKDFKPVDKAPMTIGTRARQMARYVVYQGALPMIADSPAVYEASPAGLSFLAQVPTVWDETRVVAGEFGKSIAVARRKGKIWYVGVMNDGQPRTIKLPLNFLRGSYSVETWTDGVEPTEVRYAKPKRAAALAFELGPAGGAVVKLTPRGGGRHP